MVTIYHISKSKRRYLNTKLLHQYESETEKLHRKKSTSKEACKTNNPYKNPLFFCFFWVNIAIQMLFSYLTSSIANGFSNRNCYIHRFNTWTYIITSLNLANKVPNAWGVHGGAILEVSSAKAMKRKRVHGGNWRCCLERVE